MKIIFWFRCYQRLSKIFLCHYNISISNVVVAKILEIHYSHLVFLTFKRQSHKMVKHTHTIRRQFADELFENVWPFCELALKGLIRALRVGTARNKWLKKSWEYKTKQNASVHPVISNLLLLKINNEKKNKYLCK